MRATGVFLARVLRPAAAARRMFEHFFQRLLRRCVEPPRDRRPRAGSWLEQQPRLARADVASCARGIGAAYSDERVPLTRLHNLIVRTERQIAA